MRGPKRITARPVARAVAAALALFVLTVIATWPLVRVNEFALVREDAWFTLVCMDHWGRVLTQGVDWRATPLGWPIEPGVANCDHVAAQGIASLPLALARPHVRYLIVCLLGVWSSALAILLLARQLTGPGWHTWIAPLGFGLGAMHLTHLEHANLIWHAPILGGLTLFACGVWRGRWAWALIGGLILGLTPHLGFYLGLQGLVVAGIITLVGLATGARRPAAYLAAIGGTFLGLVTVLPIALAYAGAQASGEIHIPLFELQDESLDLLGLIAPNREVSLHPGGQSMPWAKRFTDPMNAGYLVTGLGLVGLYAIRRSPAKRAWWTTVAVAIVGIALALGPYPRFLDLDLGIPGPYRALMWLPGFDGLRAPVRWLFLTHAATALLAAAGARLIVQRLPTKRRWLVALLAVGAVLEWPRIEMGPTRSTSPRPVHQTLAGGSGAVAELASGPGAPQRAMAGVLVHRRPLVGGEYARRTEASLNVNAITRRWPSSESLAFLRLIDVGDVVANQPHPDLTCTRARRLWHCPIPVRRALHTVGPLVPLTEDRPVLGVRWSTLDVDTVRLACDGVVEESLAQPWRALAAVRGAPVTAFFDTPCTGVVTSVPSGQPVSAP